MVIADSIRVIQKGYRMKTLELTRISKFRDKFTVHFTAMPTPLIKHYEKNIAGTTYFVDVHENGVVDCLAADREGKTKAVAPEVVNYVFPNEEPLKTGVKIQVDGKASYLLERVYDSFFTTKSIDELYKFLQ